MNLFYKIHLQAFNVISLVLYHSGPTFGQVSHSCLDASVFYASDYSGHLIRHILNVSEAFPTEWFLKLWEQVKVSWAEISTCPKNWRNHSVGNASETLRRCLMRWPEWLHASTKKTSRQTLDRCDKAQRRLRWRPINVFCKINSFLKRKHTVCRTFEMTHVCSRKL
jgi:hypothetical protein